jgi:lipid II:glycine glycyltransferase (peptidoglycan interpeptide bridge formation enzyme)
MPLLDPSDWRDFLQSRGLKAHLLQTEAWGELKKNFGWQPAYLSAGEAGAMILFRRLPLGQSLAYIPRGPVGDPAAWGALWKEADDLCRQRKAVFLKVEPDGWEDEPFLRTPPPGFIPSSHTIQPPRTLIVDLGRSEEELLASMKQKTRYNIRLASKKGVVVSPCAAIETFHHLMLATGERDRFGVHSLEYYRSAYDLFHPRGECELLLAEYEGEPLGGLMVFARGGRAWYFYGASADLHRELMASYLLQWEAVRWARERGCREYDLWGVPDAGEAELEAGFASRSDGLWGVYRFKRGFGGRLCRSPGPWDRVYNPPLYRLYLWKVGRAETGGE